MDSLYSVVIYNSTAPTPHGDDHNEVTYRPHLLPMAIQIVTFHRKHSLNCLTTSFHSCFSLALEGALPVVYMADGNTYHPNIYTSFNQWLKKVSSLCLKAELPLLTHSVT